MLRSLVLAYLALMALSCNGQAQTFDIFQERNGLVNVFARMKAGEPTTIAYFGGSITAGAGASNSDKTSWRSQTTDWFRRQYPKADITEVNASVGGTGSDLGAFRLQRDVLDKKPNLVFVEFAVNDYSTPPQTIERAMEGIVRQIRIADPTTEICFVYALAKEMLPVLKMGKLPDSMFHQDIIAAHYRITAVNVGAAVAEQINSGKLAWEDFSKDTCHPTDAGYAMYTDTLTSFLAQQTLHVSRQPIPYRLTDPLHTDAWFNGRETVAAGLTPLRQGWSVDTTQHSKGWPDLLVTNQISSEPVEFTFAGDTVGICYVLGPDTGNCDYKIDAEDWQPLRLFDAFAAQGARMQYRILADTLKQGVHKIYVKPRSDKDERSIGQYTRLMFFLSNEPPRP